MAEELDITQEDETEVPPLEGESSAEEVGPDLDYGRPITRQPVLDLPIDPEPPIPPEHRLDEPEEES